MAILRVNKHNKDVEKIFKDSGLSTKIQLYFSTKEFPEDYDPEENNYTLLKLNPKTIRGYVRDVSPGGLIFKSYGLHNIGAKEIICDSRYKSWFETCAKIVIENQEYQVFREAVGSRAIITNRKFRTISVILSKRTQ